MTSMDEKINESVQRMVDRMEPLLKQLCDERDAAIARVEVLEARCERLFNLATAIRDKATLDAGAVCTVLDVEAWESFTHDLALLWRERTGERVAFDAGIFLDG